MPPNAQPHADPASAARAPEPLARDGLAYVVEHGPSFATLRVELPAERTLFVQAGRLMRLEPGVEVRPALNAAVPGPPGLWAKLVALFVTLLRVAFGGDPPIADRVRTARGGRVWLAPASPGSIGHRRLHGDALFVNADAYLAHAGRVEVRVRFGNVQRALSRVAVVFFELSGFGEAWFASHGGVQRIDVRGTFLVEPHHLLAFDGALTFHIRPDAGPAAPAGAAGRVCELRGRGRAYVQGRAGAAVVAALARRDQGAA
ncbi:MAG: AIM24 family protein [Myxococcales bacterium]|nr:AIM24 family protein [Myxococcales bacterium]